MGARGEARRQAMLDAAAQLFAEKGFERTSLSDIIERSGGSRTTLYEVFGDKTGLFEAIVGETCRQVVAPLEIQAVEGRSPEEVLSNFGLHFAEFLLTPQTKELTKMLAAESGRLPQVVEFFFCHGLDAVRGRLADYLRQATEAGELCVSDPDLAASMFLSMIDGEGTLRRMFDAPGQPTVRDVRRRVQISTQVFLKGTQGRPTQ